MQVHSIDTEYMHKTVSAPASGLRQACRLAFAVVVFGLMSVGPAVAQEASETATPNKSGKICKQEVVTGSRMKKKVCHTPEQWAAREQAGKDLTRDLDKKLTGTRSADS